jgi:hypothetical protein
VCWINKWLADFGSVDALEDRTVQIFISFSEHKIAVMLECKCLVKYIC